MYTSKGLWEKSKRREILNIRLWELDNGSLINLEKINYIGKIYNSRTMEARSDQYTIDIYSDSKYAIVIDYKTEDEAKLARFKIVERWNACLDMIYSQTWCSESGTYNSSSKPIKEDNFGGYRESEH